MLKWVIDHVHPEAVVLRARRLYGGVSSLVHEITLLAGGEETSLVLRQFDNAEWVQNEPDLPLHEAASLRRAQMAAGVPTPRVIAYDETGSQCGMMAILMTRLEGEVVLEPSDQARWLDGMARALARIHAVDADDFPWTYYTYCDVSTLDTSSWSAVPEQWREAARIVLKGRPPFTKRFIHRDYHPTNMLWSGGEVSGIVDWPNGCIGPAGVDVGHCRVNLAQLYGVETADEFLSRYRSYAGASFEYDPYWDLVSLIDCAYWTPEVYPGWTALGMAGLTTELIIERLDSYLLSLLTKVDGPIPIPMEEDGE
ncbi:aminoglycoside phosphotransferase family protein [Paenibacillus montanisoli]|uniref:Aminoglycoside phosphotransferase family protein n=2 Tax=Paenibacillus montanisoli TaxID=2081970 RepID=A0A328U0K1_9BACL|nr:aminoglycoside phosphotransferase family protein [Paenibacillus montanisoli]